MSCQQSWFGFLLDFIGLYSLLMSFFMLSAWVIPKLIRRR